MAYPELRGWGKISWAQPRSRNWGQLLQNIKVGELQAQKEAMISEVA